ncbi:MAG: hypothetical protein H6858_08915 [Rhodospirillales bacterium]|nr:hypothetical protein [Alphaproteobacteria bacterium]MCB9977704.1 hypothetical protein [Rhodospirillales bacterium]
MLENLSLIITEVARFTNKHKINAEFHLHYVHELNEGQENQSECWARFERHGGVYCFFDPTGKNVKYIGMSEISTGSRLHYWLYRKNKLTEKIDREDIILHIVLEKEPYMASALETYLVQNIPTLHNVRKIEKAA